MKKCISLLMALLMALSLLPTTAWAATAGRCGENATFSLDDDGTVTISGTGWFSGEVSEDVNENYNEYYCWNPLFKRAIVEEGITALGFGSFGLCDNLEEVTLPDSIQAMYDETFDGSTALKSVRMPNNPDLVMGNYVFRNCTNLTSIVIPCKYLNSHSFSGCSSLKDITFSNNLQRIGYNSFWGCYSLEEMVIPDTVTLIGDSAFGYCTALSSLKLGSGLQSIGENAFICCSSLTNVTIPASVTSIGSGAFASCSSLQGIQVAAGNKNYTSVDGVLFTKSMDQLVCFPGGVDGDYTIPDGVAIIGGNAFGHNTGLTSITIPASMARIGDYAFTNCIELKDVYYQGTEAEWNSIDKGTGNEYLTSATIHYGTDSDDGADDNGDDLDTRLSNAGFNAPQMGSMNGDHKDFYLCTPWQDNDCVSFDYDNSGIVGKLTVTLKPATLEQWKALYAVEQSYGFGFNDSLDVNIRSDAPSGTVRGAGALIWEAGCTSTVQNFLDGNLGSYMEPYRVSGGYDGFGRYFPLISVEKRNGKVILSAESGETYYRYLMVWDNDNDDSSRLAQHNLFVTVKVESDIHYEWDVNTTMGDALRSAGYRKPAEKLIYVNMPDGLTEGVDYTYSYDDSTGHVSIQLLKSDGWMKAFEACYNRYGYAVYNNFAITTGFVKPSSKAKSVMFYMTDDDNSIVEQFAKNDFSNFGWIHEESQTLRPGVSWTMIFSEMDAQDNGDMWLFARPGTYWVRGIAVWGNTDEEILSDRTGEHKYMYTVSIQVPEDFSYGWNTRPIEERLAEAGFVAPQQDKLDEHISGALNLKMPAGLKENTDYTCKYNEKTGELNITIKKGNKADWKAAYLDSVLSGGMDRIIMNVLFGSDYDAARSVCWIGDAADLGILLWDGIWYDNRYASDVRGDFSMCGNGCTIADVKGNGNGTVTISGKKGTTELYHAVMWKDDAGNVLSKYLVKVKITVATAFSHTAVATPMMDRLNAADPARVKMELYAPNALMTSISTKGQVMLVPKAGTALTDEAGYVGDFWVQAPAGYTLQSCYLDYGPGQNSDVIDFETGTNGYKIPVDFNELTGVPYTVVRLGWKNNNANAADLIESLSVCLNSGWGKPSNHEGAPDVRDVAAIYECLTQDTTPACGDKMACDVNLDGDVDIYDLQYLYECVAQVQ